jgi:hypothetical protein
VSGTRRWQITVAALLCSWLSMASSAPGEEPLFAPDASAPPVRILLTVPAEPGKLARKVASLDRALPTTRGFLRRARTLDEADVVVSFTHYCRTVDAKGVSQDWWEGQFRLLGTFAGEEPPAAKTPRPFSLVVIGRESWEVEAVVDLLARTMAKALGRDARPRKADSI